MSNKSRARQPGAFTQALKKAIEQSAEQAELQEGNGIQDGVEDGEVAGGLPKPNVQLIGATILRWKWDTNVRWAIEATYDRSSNVYEVMPFVSQDEPYTADEAKALGEALLAAFQWQGVWQSHVGEFLVTTDTPASTFQPVPGGDQEFVPDGEPVVSDTPVGPVVYDGQRLKSVQHIGFDGGIHPGPSNPCETCDRLEGAAEEKKK